MEGKSEFRDVSWRMKSTKPYEDVKMAQKKRILVCPKCGFRFDVSYARAFACGGCPSLVSCSYVKCTKCGHEFPMR